MCKNFLHQVYFYGERVTTTTNTTTTTTTSTTAPGEKHHGTKPLFPIGKRAGLRTGTSDGLGDEHSPHHSPHGPLHSPHGLHLSPHGSRSPRGHRKDGNSPHRDDGGHHGTRNPESDMAATPGQTVSGSGTGLLVLSGGSPNRSPQAVASHHGSEGPAGLDPGMQGTGKRGDLPSDDPGYSIMSEPVPQALTLTCTGG